MYRKFRFIRPFSCEYGEIKEGSELVLIGERMFFDGGMVNPIYYDVMMQIINDDRLRNTYLREIYIPRQTSNNF